MKGRLLQLALCLILTVAALTLGAAAAEHTDHNSWTQLTTDTTNLTGGSYYLNEDVTVSGPITVSGEVTLCLNGHVLDLNGQYIYVTSGATLTLCDCNTTAEHKFTVRADGLWMLTQDTTSENVETITGGVITGGKGRRIENQNGGGVFVADNAMFNMSGGNIVGNAVSGYGGGVFLKGNSKFTMSGGSIKGNTANNGGGGVGIQHTSTFDMHGGSIKGNTTGDTGGGVFLIKNSKFTMSGGSIKGNTAPNRGGGVYVQESEFIMSGGSIEDNISNSLAGGVHIQNNSKFTMSGGSIKGNSADDYGGGVFVLSSSTFTMSGGTIEDNTALAANTNEYDFNGYGGGVHVENSTFTMSGGTIKGNTAKNCGGGVSVVRDSTFTMSGGTVSGNKAVSGGGVYVEGAYGTATFTMEEGTISGNVAELGDAVYVGDWYDNEKSSWNYGYLKLKGAPTIDGEIYLASKPIEITDAFAEDFSGKFAIAHALSPFISGWETYMSDKNLTDYFIASQGYHMEQQDDGIYFLPNSYTVQFSANGGEGTMGTQSFTYDTAQNLTANTFTRIGYTFAGWNTAPDGSGTGYVDGADGSRMPTENGGTVTLYAQWTGNIYAVTVQTDGNGTVSGPTSAATGTTVTLTATPNSGYHFDHWEVVSGGVSIENNTFTMPAGEVIVQAIFARNSSGGGGSRPTPTKTPSQQAIDKIEAAKDGETVEVDLPTGKTTLDKEVFEELAGRDVTLVLNLEDEVSWSIYGLDVPETADFADTDMGVRMNAGSVPVDIINAITGEVGTMQMTLAHDGEFGFTLTLTAPLGSKNAGYWANLYYFDEAAETLTFQTSAKIGEDGTAALVFTHASQYVIVIDDRDHTPKDFPFVDVSESDWFYEAVDYVFQRDLMNGTDATHFTPDGTSSRAMVATILWRMAGEPAASKPLTFADVPADTWYTEAVAWAAGNGIVTGYSDTKFGPDDPVTREQFAAMLYRYAQTLGEGFSGNWSFPLNFPDAAEVSDYAYEALCWLTMENVIQGMEDGNLHPQGTATRAQLATMLQRFCQAADL